ncbi:hypothetical protein ACHQM5_014856 [Ranunculus cassubicifolius]
MALELIVSPFLDLLFNKLSSLISREYRLLSGVNKDLEKLSRILSIIKNVMIDAEVKQINDKRTRDWLRELKDAAFDAEDVLDECELEALKQETELENPNCTKQVSESFSACFGFKQILFRHKMGKRIKELIERFDEIDTGRIKFQLSPGAPMNVDERLGHNRESSALLTEPKTYGRDENKKAIIQILLDNPKSSNHLSICPIVGIGGLGKTTLAQLVYNDDAVVNHFDTRIWICVSEDFSIKRITKMIIDYLTDKRCDLEDLSPMQNLLKKLLNGMTYLLVLDDVWDDKQGNWNDIIMGLLSCGGRGSSIIVTTRLPTVVGAISPLFTSCVINPTCNLESLHEEDSWSLFQYYALANGDKEGDLIEIGKVVVRKCKGVPLAIKAVGRLLSSKKTEKFWTLVRDSEIWQLEEEGENSILPALRLSYHHLPSVYRQCFAYCSVYPKDSIINKQSLIHQWMANGFVQSSRGIEAEDVGDDIFNGLLQRSFFQDKNEDEDTKEEVSCKMHDLVHDLACSITKDECWRIKTSETKDVPQRARHVSVSCDTDSNHSFNTLKKLSKSQAFFRTLMFLAYRGPSISPFSQVKCLRVLDLGELWFLKSLPSWIGHLKFLKYLNLENTDIASLPEFVCRLKNLQVLLLGGNGRLTELPSSMGNLKNLRYLDLSFTSVKVLPESISTLTNLQTLKLWFCQKLERLPREMKNMKSLRHLSIDWEINTVSLIRGMPVGIGELTRLETLGVFVVSNASDGVAGIQELGRLNKLKGSLLIKDTRHVREPRDAQHANLKNKDNLAELYLYWGSGEVDVETEEEEKKTSNQILEALEPHPNIQILQIREYPGVELPGWLRNCALTLPNLRELELFKMHNAVHDLHQLPPNLKSLWIVGCPKVGFHPELMFPSSITSLSVSASNDPTLRSVQALPHLSKLQIGSFRASTLLRARLPNLTCLQELWIVACSNVKSLLPELDNLAETLKELKILWTRDLDCITEEGLRNLASLQTLKFIVCSGLTSLSDSPSSLRHLKSLTRLDFVNCPKLILTAVDLQHLVTLQRLVLEGLPQLTSLPDGIQHVTTLQYLYTRKCKNLRTLPEWLLQQHLPPSLYYLEISGCHHELHKRCEVDKGEYWHKISHLQVHNIE